MYYLFIEFRVVQVKDQDIVQVNSDISFIDKIMEYEVYYSLKGGWGIGHGKKHDKGLK